MARTGRPQSDNPLKYDIKVRLDEETFNLLNETCDSLGVERAGFIREAIVARLNGSVEPVAGKAKDVGSKAAASAKGKAKAGAKPKATPEVKTSKPAKAASEPKAEPDVKTLAEAPKPKKNLDVFLL